MPLTELEQQLLKALQDLVRECDNAEDIDDLESQVNRAKQTIREAERRR